MDYQTSLGIQLAITLLYAFIGFGLFIYHKESMVIKNRLPNLVLIEASTMLANMIFTIDPGRETDKYISCFVYQSLTSIITVSSLTLILCRMSFIYNYLMNPDLQKRFGLHLLCRLFWTDNKRLKTRNLIAVIFVSFLGAIANIYIYDAATEGSHEAEVVPKCQEIPILFQAVFNYISVALFILIAVQFIRYRIFDQIWMSSEFIIFLCVVVIESVIYVAIYGYIDSVQVRIESCICLTFSLYFPLIVHWRHTVKMQKTLSKTSLINSRIMELCRQFYCEENGIFLESYEKYKQGLITVDYLTTMFIENGSIFELNIPFNLKIKVLNGIIGTERDAALAEVYYEIKMLVQLNILPYLEKESS